MYVCILDSQGMDAPDGMDKLRHLYIPRKMLNVRYMKECEEGGSLAEQKNMFDERAAMSSLSFSLSKVD